MAKQIELIRQALSASESSIRLAKQLLNDLEQGGERGAVEKKVLPGVTGAFDGESMVAETGEKYPVPANYASKSLLVVGDVLKLVEEGKEKRFKQLEHVKRYKTKGVLTKKDGKFHAVTPEGSYRVLPAAVDHFNVAVGDEVVLILPAKNLQVGWGAVEAAVGKEPPVREKPTVPEVSVGAVSEEPKEEKPDRVETKEKEEEKKPAHKPSPKHVIEKKKEEAAKAPVAPPKKEAPVEKVEVPKEERKEEKVVPVQSAPPTKEVKEREEEKIAPVAAASPEVKEKVQPQSAAQPTAPPAPEVKAAEQPKPQRPAGVAEDELA